MMVYNAPFISLSLYLSYKFVAEGAGGKEVELDLLKLRWYVDVDSARLKKENCIINDKVVFFITTTYLVPEFIDDSVRKCKTQFQPFELMCRDSDSCDVKFVVAGSAPVLAHRAYLSLVSPVFEAMFDHDTKEAQTGIIDIIDFDHETVKTAIDLLYGHPFEPDSNEVVDNVSRFAGKYLIDAVNTGLDNLAPAKRTKPYLVPKNILFCLLPALTVAVIAFLLSTFLP